MTINIRDGVPGGPLTLFDRQGHSLIISAYSQFMAASIQHHGLVGGSISWGIMGSVTQIPSEYSYATVMYYGPNGINEVKVEFGSSNGMCRNWSICKCTWKQKSIIWISDSSN